MAHDSRADTEKHIALVRRFLREFMHRLELRAQEHDASKLIDPEKSAFDIITPRLEGVAYGSDEYRATLREMEPAIRHHYSMNSHHPEHYDDGLLGMDLLDFVEMLCDWKAATLRHDDGDISRSIEINRERLGMEPQLVALLANTAQRMAWAAG